MSYAIVFSSKTGNTALLAQTLREQLPQTDCCYFGAPDEVVLLEVENSADVQKVVDILQKAVDEGAVESEGTDEAITAAWKDNASITTDGNYICLAVFMNGVSIPAEFMLP